MNIKYHSILSYTPSSEYLDQPMRGIVAQNKPMHTHAPIAVDEHL